MFCEPDTFTSVLIFILELALALSLAREQCNEICLITINIMNGTFSLYIIAMDGRL